MKMIGLTVTTSITRPTGYEHEWLPAFKHATGPQNVPADASEVDIIGLFLNDNHFNMLVTETNRYAQQFLHSNPVLSPHARAKK